jgi:hypothetical protein
VLTSDASAARQELESDTVTLNQLGRLEAMSKLSPPAILLVNRDLVVVGLWEGAEQVAKDQRILNMIASIGNLSVRRFGSRQQD